MHQTIEIPGQKWRLNRPILFLAVVIAALLLGGSTALSYYVDALWFGSLGYRDVFWKSRGIQWSIFAAFFAGTFLILYGWFLILWQMHETDLPHDRPVFIGRQQLILPLRRTLRYLGIVASLGIAAITGASMMAEWPTFALIWYAPPGARTGLDPVLGKPLSFYLFTLPAWQLICSWLMVLAVITCAAALGFLLFAGSKRTLGTDRGRSIPLPWRGFSISYAFFLLILAAQVYLARFSTLLEPHTIFSGVTYTDAHVTITGLLVVAVALLFGAAIATINVVKTPRAYRLLVALLPAVACFLVMHLGGVVCQQLHR